VLEPRTRNAGTELESADSNAARISAIAGIVGPVDSGRAPAPMTHAESPTWRIPPRWVRSSPCSHRRGRRLGRRSDGQIQGRADTWARDGMLAHPYRHGLGGVSESKRAFSTRRW